jgi:hypothetical protein
MSPRPGLILLYPLAPMYDTPQDLDITITIPHKSESCLQISRIRLAWEQVTLGILSLSHNTEIKDLLSELDAIKDNLYFLKKGLSCFTGVPPNHPNLKVEETPDIQIFEKMLDTPYKRMGVDVRLLLSTDLPLLGRWRNVLGTCKANVPPTPYSPRVRSQQTQQRRCCWIRFSKV